MTRKQVQSIIDANLPKSIYVLSGAYARIAGKELRLTYHEPMSKSNLLRCSRFFDRVEIIEGKVTLCEIGIESASI
jgi:hypothetical protein